MKPEVVMFWVAEKILFTVFQPEKKVMALSIPPSAKILTSSKSEIQISHDGISSLKSKGRQLPRPPTVPDDLSKGTVLVRHPLPKYSFQSTLGKKKAETSKSLSELNKVDKSDKNDTTSLPIGTVKPVSKVEPYLDQDEKSNLRPQSEAPKLEMVLRNASPLDWPGSEAEVKRLKAEVVMLRGELDVQVKVNSELKKLLVASVGDDLHSRVERLARRITTDDIKSHHPAIACNPESAVIPRYHPKAKFDNLTFNCCPHCAGEIIAV
ncbi:unnamed protein product [Mytilus edulis]|uniref:Uncharacterized protein n=1 Tax=Mytilus edulis TaxID=6550 RepID=A0A8S3TTN7_MYTED|nr:unnamed protein product [Mytilus edulis]